MGQLRLGDPLDKNTDIGPLVATEQLERVRSMLAEGEAQGATLWRPDCPLPETGYFHLPVLATDVGTSNVLAQEEVFGPVLAAISFRTTDEAVELANNTRYGLAASVWSENVNLALHVAPQLKAGVVWVNGTNLFDAACGFGGYRESGFWARGRPRGHARISGTGSGEKRLSRSTRGTSPAAPEHGRPATIPSSTAPPNCFIGGKQVRPDGAYSYPIHDAKGKLAGEAGLGSRKDIRDAVSAARKCGWASTAAHNRAQVLFFLAENLAIRTDEFSARIASLTGASAKAARAEVEAAIERIFAAAGMADKFEGSVHQPPLRAIALALHEPVGTLGIVAPDDQPLLGLVAMLAPALANGQCGRGHSLAAPRAGRHRPLPGLRDLGPARRRGQHRNRKAVRTGRGAGQT